MVGGSFFPRPALYFVLVTRKLILIIFLCLLSGGLVFFLLRTRPWLRFKRSVSKPPAVKVLDYQDEVAKIRLKYPEGFNVGQLSQENRDQDLLLLKLVRVEPPTLVISWFEGLGLLEAFTKRPLLEQLKDNVERRYSAEYKDFKKEKIEGTTLAGLPAFTVWFTFQDPKKTYREKIRLTVTVKESKGIYLQCQAPEAMWDFAEPSCDLIKNSFAFLP